MTPRARQRFIRYDRDKARAYALNRLIAPVVRIEERPSSEVDELIRCVADVVGVALDAVMSGSRDRDVSYGRHLAMWALRRHMRLSVADVSRVFGRDHSTVIQGVRRIDGELKVRPETREDVDLIAAWVAAKA